MKHLAISVLIALSAVLCFACTQAVSTVPAEQPTSSKRIGNGSLTPTPSPTRPAESAATAQATQASPSTPTLVATPVPAFISTPTPTPVDLPLPAELTAGVEALVGCAGQDADYWLEHGPPRLTAVLVQCMNEYLETEG